MVEHRARGAEEDHDVGGPDGPLAPFPVGHGEATVQQFPDAFGGKAGLHQVTGGLLPVVRVLRRGVQGVQLHRVAAVGPVRRAGVQGLVVGVVHLAEGGGHEIAEQEVGPLQHLGPGAEVLGENQPPGLPLRRAGVVGPGPVLAQEDGGVGQAEAVDGLLHVPHQKEVGAVPGQGGEDGILHLVGVLVLVHHDLVVPGRPLAGQLGGGTVLPHQQPHRHVLQIGKVHHAPTCLLGGVGRLEVLYQGEQTPHCRVDGPEILQQIRPAVLEPAGELVHPLLAGGAEALDLLRRIGAVHDLLPPRRGERDGQDGAGRVPTLRRPLDEGVQPRQSSGQAGAVIGVQVGVAGAELQSGGDLPPPVSPLPGRVIQQQAAPGGVGRVAQAIHCKGFLLFIQPGGGVGVGLHPAPDVQDDLHQPGVVPPGGHGVHQLGEVAARHDVLIAPLQHVVEGPEHEDARLPLVAQAEVRVQVQQVAALPQQLGAKGVDRGDLGFVNQSRLTAQMGVGGVLRQPGGQLLHDAAPQLGGGGLGVGDHQEAVDVQPLPRHPGQEPLHQHPGLARPGRGGHQQPAAPVVYRSLLFGCQGECHGRCSFLVSCKTICRGGYHPPAWWRPGLPAGACPARAPISSRRNGGKEGPGGFAKPVTEW